MAQNGGLHVELWPFLVFNFSQLNKITIFFGRCAARCAARSLSRCAPTTSAGIATRKQFKKSRCERTNPPPTYQSGAGGFEGGGGSGNGRRRGTAARAGRRISEGRRRHLFLERVQALGAQSWKFSVDQCPGVLHAVYSSLDCEVVPSAHFSRRCRSHLPRGSRKRGNNVRLHDRVLEDRWQV